MAEVRMPKMGDGMEEGTITSWLKKEGDQIHEGDMIAEVETDKANVEIPAEESGVLSKIVVSAGQTVSVGAVIAQIGEGGAQTTKVEQPVDHAESAPTTVETKHALPQPFAPESVTDADAGATGPTEERIKASPLARRMARDLEIDLARVRGTGPGGRIVERDVKAFQDAGPDHAHAPTMPAIPSMQPPKAVPQPVGASMDIKPSKMREAIARRTVLSKQTTPHFYVTMLVEVDRLLGMLKDLNVDASEGKITVNDVLVKASAIALGQVPEVNATWTPEGTVRRFSETHIGIAVGIEDGLIIPVVPNCHIKTLRQISAEAKVLIGKARNNQLKPSEYSGGTFSISNLGMMGVDEFIAIINPPEAAILAIGGIVREPVVTRTSDEIVIRSRMKITISADHRVLDGVTAARFLQEMKRLLESPFSLLS